MKKYLLLYVLLLLFSSSLTVRAQMQTQAGSAVPSAWFGEYTYAVTGSTNVAGYTDVTEYTLSIVELGQRGNATGCHFVVAGPQLSNADYECRANLSGDKLTFYFVRSLEPMSDGQVKRMKPGFIIGSLVKTLVRGKLRYRLEAGRYEFDMISTKAHPVYFKKTK